MASLSSPVQIFSGDTTVIDTTQKYPFLQKAVDENGNEYIYVKGVSNAGAGSWVTYDEVGVTALLAANAKGFVAALMAALDANTDFGWACIRGNCEADLAANTADNALLGRETSDGLAGDGYAAGDMIYGAMSRDATTDAATVTVQLLYPFVTDEST